MAMPQVERIWTRAEVLALPDDGNRYELIGGELLVSPSPRLVHQLALYELFHLVDGYVRRHHLGVTGLSPADLDLGLGDVSQPDLFVVRHPEDPARDGWRGVGVPLLAVEVISPTTARHDRITKRRRYQTAGVASYWIVDLDLGLVERWHPNDQEPTLERGTLRWYPSAAGPPLEIALDAYFRPEWRTPPEP